MISKLFTAAAAFGAVVSAAAADAATFRLDYQGAVSIEARLTANDLGGSRWLVTGLIGTVREGEASQAMTLLAGGPDVFGIPGFNVDDLLYDPAVPGASFDIPGLAFSAAGRDWNLWGNGAGQPYSLQAFDGSGYPVVDFGRATITPVPESATWILLLAGFAGLAVAARGNRLAVGIG